MTQLCGAKKRQGPPGSTCTLAAGWGTEHVGAGRCKLHGGNTPTQAAAAAATLADRNAKTWLGQNVTVGAVDNPLLEFRELAGKSKAWLEACEGVMAKLGADNMRYYGKTGEQLRAEVVVFERAVASLTNVLSAYARLNIDERLAGVTIEVKKSIMRAIEAALASAGVAGPAAIEAKKVAARHLRVVGPDDDIAV